MPAFFRSRTDYCDGNSSHKRDCNCRTKISLYRNSNFSKSGTTVPSDTDFESDYVTGLEDFPNDETEMKKPRLRRKLFKGLNDPRQTSFFIQNILSEDAKTGIAVVDLFVAIKKVKDNLDFLVRRNDDILRQIDALNVESGVVRNEYRNLAENMRSFLDELKDEPGNVQQLKNLKCNSDKPENVQDESLGDPIEDSCPKCSKNSPGDLECVPSASKNSTEDRPIISETLLGSFLASVLWLKQREVSLSKPLCKADNKERKESVNDPTVRMIYDIWEMVGGLANSTSEDKECCSDKEEQIPYSKKTHCETVTESDESESAFEDVFETPPPSPPHSFVELNSKASVTCMSGFTRGDKEETVTKKTDDTFSVSALTEDVKSTIEYLRSHKNSIIDQLIRRPDPTNKLKKKLPKPVEFTVAANPTTFDLTVKDNEEPQSYSSDSVTTLADFDSDHVGTSSLSGEDEMEDFVQTNVIFSKADSKAVEPRTNDAPMLTTYKTAKPSFFEVWKRYPKLFVQEIISKTAEMRQGESWEVKKYKNPVADQVVTLVPGGKREQEVVIENSNLDLVIYIQVEVEDDNKKEQLVVDFETNSLGTQTSNHGNGSARNRYEDEKQSEKSLYDIWKKCKTEEMEKAEESVRVTFDERRSVVEQHEKDPVTRTVTFRSDVSKVLQEKDSTLEQKKPKNALAVAVSMKQEILTATVHYEQQEFYSVYVIDRPQPFYRPIRNVELERALQLIHEIENNVVDTKLSDAISILPRLESELRRHFKHKVKSMQESQMDSSLDTFFSAIDAWPVDGMDDAKSESSEERLCNLLTLLGDIERAVKASECSTGFDLCGYNSSKIYGLLHALTESIRELEQCSNVVSLSQTLDIASQLDTAVREYEGNIVTRSPKGYAKPVNRKNRERLKSQTSREISSIQNLVNVRKRVFQMVEEEAVDTEARLEKYSDKLSRLERENDEANKFVEAFLQKTQRRVSELDAIKGELKELSKTLAELWEEMVKTRESKKKEKSPEKNYSHENRSVASSLDAIPNEKLEPVKETVSGLLHALDKLKSRAREKNEVCREILTNAGLEKEIKDLDVSARSSRSSYTSKNVENTYSWVKDFKKIGDQSLYLSWTKPEGPFADSFVGYEIFVNGKLNQKVRNPKRLQAVIYSIDLSTTVEVLLYGILENGFRSFLSSVTYANS